MNTSYGALFITSVFAFQLAFAQASPIPTDFQSAGALFDAGAAPSNLRLGTYAGRCHGLIDGTGGTPILAPASELFIVDVSNSSQGANATTPNQIGFGDLTSYDVPSEYFDGGQHLPTNAQIKSVLPATSETDGLVETYKNLPSSADEPQLAEILRQNGNFLVVKDITLVDDAANFVKAGDALFYCFYYIKLN